MVEETLKEDVRREVRFGISTPADLIIVDYNSWQESDQGLRLAATLDKDVVLAEGMSNIAVRK